MIFWQLHETLDTNKRAELYREFQEKVRNEHAAVFLYSPAYLSVITDKVQGFDLRSVNTPADRFDDVTRWYIKTKRVKK